ncbi:MAG TPA: APC family permease [Gemmatimonadaceae bacterium]|nr:APC family permease [Gemmatimonadaceae bacterium]
MGATIGGGILRTPGSIAAALPNRTLFMSVWVLGGVVTLFGAAIYAELGAMIPRAGGPYTFSHRAFGNGMGFFVGYGDWLNFGLGYAFLILLASEYVGSVIPFLSGHVRAIALTTLCLFAAINWLGIRQAGWTQEITSALKAVALIALIIAAFAFPHTSAVPATAVHPLPHGLALLLALGIAMQGVFFTYDSYYMVVYCSEEIRDPGREIPRSIFSGVWLVIVIYLLVNAAFLAVLPMNRMANDPFVAATVANAVFGRYGEIAIRLLMIVSLFGAISAGIIAAPRIILAMARDGLFPRQATRVNERGTPVIALFMTVILIGAFIMSGTSDQVLAADILLAASLYVITFTSFFVLRRREPNTTRPYKAPFYPVIPGLALLSVAAIVASMIVSDHRSAIVVGALLAISWPASRLVQRLIAR